MVRSTKTLNNLSKNVPAPGTQGKYPQILISDGQDGTLWSTSLIGEEAAVLSVYVAESFDPAVGGWTVPANSPSIRLVSGIINSGDVVLALDASATTTRAFTIFNPFTGANNTDQKTLISVNYSVNFTGATNGECGVWIQIVGADLVVKTPRYGSINQQNISVGNGGNQMTGGTAIGLEVGESAAFFLKNTATSTQVMIGGDIFTEPLVTKFQSALIN